MSKTDKMTDSRRLNQTGMVSIMVTLIMMIVITLIVLGFSQVARRNGREALDRQLSSQAYYAAESGINDALTAIKAGKVTNLDTNADYATKCSGPTSLIQTLQTIGITSSVNPDAAANTNYSCLLVNNKPTSLPVPVGPSDSQVVPLNLTQNLAKLNFTWHPTGTGAVGNCPAAATANVFRPSTAWTGALAGCPYGLLRADIVDTAGAPAFDASLAARTVSLFIVPTKQVGAYVPTQVTFHSADNTQQVYVVSANCTASICNATISVAGGSQKYAARLNSVYQGLGTVTITPTDTNGNPEALQDAQLVIDATGKSQDVLRRVQVRVRLTGNGEIDPIPTYAIQGTAGICKRFTTLQQPTSRASDAANDSTIPTNICAP